LNISVQNVTNHVAPDCHFPPQNKAYNNLGNLNHPYYQPSTHFLH